MKQKRNRNASHKNSQDKPESRRPLFLAGLCAIVVIGIAAVILIMLSHRSATHRFSWVEGGYYDEKDKVTYLSASLSYRAVKPETDYFGSTDSSRFYRIAEGEDDYIAEVFIEDTTPYLCYREGVSLPGLTELAPTRMQICDNLGVTFYDVKDLSLIDEAAELLSQPAQLDHVDGLETDAYRLVFRSELYPMMAYEVKIELTDRGRYLWDRGTNRVYTLPASIADLLSGKEKG